MGGFTGSRNYLFNLFSFVFRRSIEREREFCLVVVDLMQFLAGKVKFVPEGLESAMDIHGLTGSMRQTAESYMPHYNTEFCATKAVVVLLDTPKNVPTNKAATQQKRDATASTILNEATYNEYRDFDCGNNTGLGDLLKWPLNGEMIWRSNNTRFQLYALITEELLRIQTVGDVSFVIDDGVDINHELYEERREQMIRDHYFEDRSLYEQECLVANLARHHFTERFILRTGCEVERLPQTGIGEADIKIPGFVTYNKYDPTATCRYMIVSQDTDLIFILLLHLKTLLTSNERDEDPSLEVWLDTQKPSDRKVGYSRPYRYIDVKALYYAIITLFGKEYPSIKTPIETFVFLVYCLETDFTSPFDKHLTVTPRVVWNTFSALHTPVERIKTDGYLVFNDAMYDPTTFVPIAKKTAESESARMGVKRSVERQYAFPLQWHSLLGEGGVTYTYNNETDHYDIELDDLKCQTFFYLLCQLKVLDDLSSLGHTQFKKKQAKGGTSGQRTYIMNTDELFIWVSSIEGRVEQHRLIAGNEDEGKKRKAIEMLSFRGNATTTVGVDAVANTTKNVSNKKPKLLQVYPPRLPVVVRKIPSRPLPVDLISLHERFCTPKMSDQRQLIDEIEEIEVKKPPVIVIADDESEELLEDMIEDDDDEDPATIPPERRAPLIAMPTTSITIRKELTKMCNKTIPPQYGIPALQGMLARIARITWIMNYHQNGWRCPSYVTNFAEPHPSDATLSRYGWKGEEVLQNDENLRAGAWNNSYYTSVFEEGVEPGVIPMRVYRMVETDQVYNKSHDTYRNSFSV